MIWRIMEAKEGVILELHDYLPGSPEFYNQIIQKSNNIVPSIVLLFTRNNSLLEN